jgi:hypothetical protein
MSDKNMDKRSELVQVKKKQQLGCSSDTQFHVDTEEPASECGGAMLDKEQTHLLAVAEEETASKKPSLRKHKDKRSELVQLKKEQQLGSFHLTQLPVHREKPASAGASAMLDM